ncbi:MAG TPA: hypothetical protein VNJ02_01815 [Vicinamibacterales bacterium]|nr:hypothetical protein [Vicinamibacterales bacterium]
MLHGHITRLVPEHGFGFLLDDAGLEWFFVRDGARDGFDQLQVKERVGFAQEWTPKGPRAVDIHYDPSE